MSDSSPFTGQASLDAKLMIAATRFDPAAVRAALELGANPNARHPSLGGPTALMRSCERAHPDAAACTALLLDAGADPNLLGYRGQSAAMWAAGQGNRLGFEALALAGADLNAIDDNGRRAEDYSERWLDTSFSDWISGFANAWREAKDIAASTSPAPILRKPGL